MTSKTEIPEDVMKAAEEAHAEFAKSSVRDNLTTIIARAIMAERERLLAKAIHWGETYGDAAKCAAERSAKSPLSYACLTMEAHVAEVFCKKLSEMRSGKGA